MSIVSLALGAFNVAKAVGGVTAGVEMGEVVLKKTGLLKPETSILGEATSIACEVLGIPERKSPTAPAPGTVPLATPAANPPDIGAAPAAQERVIAVICPDCYGGGAVLSGFGEAVLGHCEEHARVATDTASRVTAMYDGWAKAWGLGDVAACGKKPNPNDKKYLTNVSAQVATIKAMGTTPKIVNMATYYRDLAEWQDCVQREKDAAAADKAAVEAAKKTAYAEGKKKGAGTAKKISTFAMNAQKSKYEKQLADLQAQQDLAKTEAEKAAFQAKIDEAEKAKALAEQLAAELKSQTADADTKAKIAALEAQIASKAQQPGGMDEFFKMLLMKQLMAPAPAVQPYSASPVDPYSLAPTYPTSLYSPAPVDPYAYPGSAPAVPWAPSPEMYFDQSAQFDPSGGGFPDMFGGTEKTETEKKEPIPAAPAVEAPAALAGPAQDAIPAMEPSFEEVFPYMDGLGEEDQFALFGLAQTGDYDSEGLLELATALNDADENGLSGCAIGACGR